MGLERTVRHPAGNRALDALRRRSPRPAQGHPIQHHHQERAFRGSDRSLDHHDRQRPGDRCAFPGHLLRHVVRAAHVPFPGTGDVQGAVVSHRALAEGPGRFRRQARRRSRHRRHGDPGHSDHCGQGRPSDGVRPHAAIHDTNEEPEIHARRPGGVQVGVQPVRSASAAHIQRLCVRFRKPVGHADAGAAPRRAGGDLGGRLAEVLDRVLRGTLRRSGG